jgi:hypothetical protein
MDLSDAKTSDLINELIDRQISAHDYQLIYSNHIGHWRKQWYPSQERNVPIWISPYVKGPDGAPLLAGEKVYAWQR